FHSWPSQSRRYCSRACYCAPVSERFWSKVNKNGPMHPALKSRCWLWMDSVNTGGYGRFYLNGAAVPSHRWAWTEVNGEPPSDQPYVLHKCDNPPCVRPDHLFTGTGSDNQLDMVRKGRGNQASGDNHGLRKHPER